MCNLAEKIWLLVPLLLLANTESAAACNESQLSPANHDMSLREMVSELSPSS